MYRLNLSRAFAPGLLAVVLAAGPGGALPAQAQRAVQAPAQPAVSLAGEQLPDLTRYSLTLSNRTPSTLSDLQVSVQLPEDAVYDHALETPGYTHFEGADDQTLTWTGASFAPDDVVDAFTFFLAQPVSGAFDVQASWNGDSPGQVESHLEPVVRAATDTEADITIDATALAQAGSLPVGNTGVVLDAVSGQIPDGTTLHVRVLGPDSNPSAVPGDLWWCSIVQVDGLPADAGVLLEVPARQPLPPAAAIQLFGQRGSQWDPLADAAQVTADGQSILYVQHPGSVAAGTGSNNQPRLPIGLVVQGVTPAGRLAQVSAPQVGQQLGLMVQPAHCPPANCTGPDGRPLPPCLNSSLLAGQQCANGSIRAAGDAVQGVIGTTICRTGGGPCTGFVGLLPFGNTSVQAPPGHGIRCSGFSVSDLTTNVSCTQF